VFSKLVVCYCSSLVSAWRSREESYSCCAVFDCFLAVSLLDPKFGPDCVPCLRLRIQRNHFIAPPQSFLNVSQSFTRSSQRNVDSTFWKSRVFQTFADSC